MFTRVRRYQIFFWNFKLTWHVHKGKTIPAHMSFALTWNVHKGKMISRFPHPWKFNLTWHVHKGKMISRFPPPWNVKLACNVQEGRMISKFSHPWDFTLVVSVYMQEYDDFKSPTPHGIHKGKMISKSLIPHRTSSSFDCPQW